MEQLIAHVDMDCFFAACEEKKDPSLKGKPVIIGPSKDAKRGVVSTANYVARKYGVKSAMPISEARRRCPDGMYIRGDFEYYRSQSKEIMYLLRSFSSDFEQVSIDEAYLDITSFASTCTSFEEAATRIKNIVHSLTGLTCSIGVSSSRYVSKIASDHQKPNGVTIVTDHKSFLAPKKVSVVPGCGKVFTKVLNSHGIFTLADLAQTNRMTLLDTFGKHILHFHRLACGEDESGICSEPRSAKSISKEVTFQEDIVKAECEELIPVLSKKLRTNLGDSHYKTVSIKVRFSDFTTITRDLSLSVPLQSTEVICSKAQELLEQVQDEQKIRLFGIKLGKLSSGHYEQKTLGEFC